MDRVASSSSGSEPAVPDFTPVPVRARKDGWTAERQRAFMGALAATHCIGRAAQAARMSRESAYRLRRRKGAESFAAAWDRIVAARPRGATGFDLQWHRLVRGVTGGGARPARPEAAPAPSRPEAAPRSRQRDRESFERALRAFMLEQGLPPAGMPQNERVRLEPDERSQ